MVLVDSHNIISPLGFSSEENFNNVFSEISGVSVQNRPEINTGPFHASLFTAEQRSELESAFSKETDYTFFEKVCIASVKGSLSHSKIDAGSEETIFILSTTKGNIDLLNHSENIKNLKERISLSYSAKLIATYFKNPNQPVVISNACISGVMAILYAKRVLENKQFKNAVVVGADVLDSFVFSGFKSFQALSAGRCKPFSNDRDGINLGEAASTVILSAERGTESFIKVGEGAITNDANHISGPSRTGDELAIAIARSLKGSGLNNTEVDYVSAHGTATIYNDEMESKALSSTKLSDVPVNSLKGYFGHTLGAAGILECVMGFGSMAEGKIAATAGFTQLGVPCKINVSKETISKLVKNFIKTASGFGGCNAALLFQQIN